MITGVVTADREPILEVILHDTNGQEYQYEAVVDTGYTGWLTLPPNIVTMLGLVWRERERPLRLTAKSTENAKIHSTIGR